MTEREKIVITGLGAVTPIGIGVSTFWEHLLAGKSGIRTLDRLVDAGLPATVAAEVSDFQPDAYMPKKLARNSARFAQFAYVAAEEALLQSGLDLAKEHRRIGITMGTALSGVSVTADTQAHMTETGKIKVSPRFVPQILGNIAASQIAIEKDLQGPCYTVSTACSSGADALDLACMLLHSSEADVVLAVGADSAQTPIVLSSLSMAKALSPNPDPLTACRPFDEQRDGFVMGEGGGAMVLELESHALKRGANILGVFAGVANNTDAYHVVTPAPDGRGEIACMERALQNANLTPSDIGYVNAHGTSTAVGDPIECESIHKIFGDSMPFVSSTKGATGHMMGAGGIIEAIICLLSVRESVLPFTVGCRHPDASCSAPIITGKPRQCSISYAMSNSFGFGGQNASLIIGAYDHEE